jgi:hypothetical protein
MNNKSSPSSVSAARPSSCPPPPPPPRDKAIHLSACQKSCLVVRPYKIPCVRARTFVHSFRLVYFSQPCKQLRDAYGHRVDMWTQLQMLAELYPFVASGWLMISYIVTSCNKIVTSCSKKYACTFSKSGNPVGEWCFFVVRSLARSASDLQRVT